MSYLCTRIKIQSRGQVAERVVRNAPKVNSDTPKVILITPRVISVTPRVFQAVMNPLKNKKIMLELNITKNTNTTIQGTAGKYYSRVEYKRA